MAFRGRKEDARLVTGAGRYTADWNAPDQLYASFVRSPHARARLVSVDADAARQAEGVVAVLTGQDIAGAQHGTIQAVMLVPGRGGTQLATPDRPILATDTIRFLGEGVAIVIATTANAAHDAADLVVVEYDALTPVIGFDAALRPSAPIVHQDRSSNICFEHDYGDPAAVEAALATAPHVVRLTLESPRVAPCPMEPRAVLGWYDSGRDAYCLRCSHQGADDMRGGLATMLGVAPDRVRVEMVDVGGAFGARGTPYFEYVAVLEAARILRRPVKWVSTRADDLMIDSHGRAIRLEGELALDRDGIFLALRTRWLCDQGAYLTLGGPLTNVMNGSLAAAGPYRTPLLHGHHILVMTNTNPTNAYRGAGRPEAAYVIERLVDQAAFELGLDPIDIRRRNALPAAAMPYTTPTGSVFDSGDFPALLETVSREADWPGAAARKAEALARGRLHGIGVALFLEPSGGGAPRDETALRFGPGGAVTVFIAPQSNGQSHETVFAELIAGRLGLDRDDVHVRGSDPDGPPVTGGGSFGSRSMMVQGSLLAQAADEVIRKGLSLAADDLEASADDIEFADGMYRVIGTDRTIALLDIAQRPGGVAAHPLDTDAFIGLPRSYPSAAHVAEVEIDPDTGVVQVLSYVAVDDVGRVINKAFVEGQVHGGLTQGAGQVFGEHCVYDLASGQLVTGSFMDYVMPRADLMPRPRIIDASMPSPFNPLGAKGVGESGTVGAAPTLMNAIMDALRPIGITAFDMPATPQRVWAAINAAGSRSFEPCPFVER